MSLNEEFNLAAERVRKLNKKPSDKDLLEWYALYKQATIGDCNTAKPSDARAKLKWDAWNLKKGLSQDEAKNAYILKTNQSAPSFE